MKIGWKKLKLKLLVGLMGLSYRRNNVLLEYLRNLVFKIRENLFNLLKMRTGSH